MTEIKKLIDQLGPFQNQPDEEASIYALTPHDGRYARTVFELRKYCSEAGLQRLRTMAEIEYLIHLNQVTGNDINRLRQIYLLPRYFNPLRIKEIEAITNHDVKSVEYFINENLDQLGLRHLKNKVHIYLTSEDVTNCAIAFMVYGVRKIIIGQIDRLLALIEGISYRTRAQAMLSRTHGQPASPTTVGKEFMVFAHRIREVRNNLEKLPIKIKWNSASGNYNAQHIGEPERDWIEYSRSFVEGYLGFTVELYSGQTVPYIYLADILDQCKRLSSIMIDMARDMWSYVSLGYFKLKPKAGEVGSSVMPHKVNPINFENAEGNLEMAEPIFNHLACKLQKSRLQRDLSDSTTLRNLGLVFGYLLLGIDGLKKGLSKIDINEERIMADLQSTPEVLGEPIQTLMRTLGIDNAYEQLKELLRGQSVDLHHIREFINALQIPMEEKQRLLQLEPKDYTGLAEKLVEHYLENR